VEGAGAAAMRNPEKKFKISDAGLDRGAFGSNYSFFPGWEPGATKGSQEFPAKSPRTFSKSMVDTVASKAVT